MGARRHVAAMHRKFTPLKRKGARRRANLIHTFQGEGAHGNYCCSIISTNCGPLDALGPSIQYGVDRVYTRQVGTGREATSEHPCRVNHSK